MELKDFVKNTLLDIIEGVREAQESNTTNADIGRPYYQASKQEAWTNVHFDVAVTTDTKADAKGIVVVSAAMLGAGKLGLGVKSESSKVSRICFDIDVRMTDRLKAKPSATHGETRSE